MILSWQIIVIVILLVYYNKRRFNEYFSSTEKSTYDNKNYRVVAGFHDKNIAADNMAKANEFINAYLKYAKNKFITNSVSGVDNKRAFFTRIINNYNPNNLFENNPSLGEETSFVSNKGEEFGICLRKKGPMKDQLHDMNIIKFVILHELTHLGCISYGHDREFWHWFKIVLEEAVNSGLYIPIDYSKQSVNYCGLEVTHNPYCINNKC
jgi:hypothetical protein